MTVTIGRRELLAALGGAAAAWPLAASAERATRVTPVKQIRLTERQIQGFIAAQKEMAVVAEFGQRDPRLQTESDTVANKNGFKDFAEYDEVAANILMIFAGINPQTRRYTDPQTAMNQKIAEITADKTLAATDKKELLNEFEKRLNAAQARSPAEWANPSRQRSPAPSLRSRIGLGLNSFARIGRGGRCYHFCYRIR